MQFTKMPISKKIILGYVIFFIILISISAFVIIQNITSASNADTLSVNDETNTATQEALNRFLNARVYARILMMSDDYDDSVYDSALAELDGCLEHINEGLVIVKEQKMTQREQLLTNTISNVEQYKNLVSQLHTVNRERLANSDSLPALGRQVTDALNAVVETENQIIKSSIASGSSALLNDYENFYAFTDVKLSMYNARLTSTRLSYLGDITSYDSIMAALEDVKVFLVDYRENLPAARRGAVDDTLGFLEVYGKAFTSNRDLLAKMQEYQNNLIAANVTVQTSLGEASTISTEGLSDMVRKIQTSAATSLWVVIILLAAAFIINIILAVAIVSSINKALNGAMQKLTETTESVVSASGQLLSAAGSLAQGGSEQAAAIEETSATMNETASMIQLNTENTRQAASLANDTAGIASQGVNEMVTLIEFMDKLSKSSGEISKIVDNINTIAFQTNILALNASVEAVRAGDAGRSFAVVAEEVRNLSQSSSEAANNTSTIISENITLSDQSVHNSRSVGETLKNISSAIQKVTNLVNEISAASEEQSRGVQQVNIALSQMEKVTQSNAAVSEQSAAAANELMSQANTLERITEEIHELVGN